MQPPTEPISEQLPPPLPPGYDDVDFAPPQGPPAGTTVTTTTSTSQPKRIVHIVLVVIGCMGLVAGLGSLATGASLIAVSEAGDGYFDVTLDQLDSDGVAIASVDLWDEASDDEDLPWVLDVVDLKLRLRVEGAGPTDEVFIGIARTADVEGYLAGAPYSEVDDLDDRTPRYEQRAGSASVAPPIDQTFWTVSASGSGEQEVIWEARPGDWSIVVMNADGSAEVSSFVTIGARSDAVTPIGIVVVVIGCVIGLIALVMVIIGARGLRAASRSTAQTTSS